jgi:hypothetical protein
MGRLGCPVLDIPHAEHPLIHHSSHPRIWCPISLQFWFVCTWRVKTDDTNDFEWEMYRAINIHNHLNFDLFIIWIIYGNLNATSLEWWLARVTIPKYVQPDFRVGELLHFVSRTHVCIYIYMEYHQLYIVGIINWCSPEFFTAPNVRSMAAFWRTQA